MDTKFDSLYNEDQEDEDEKERRTKHEAGLIEDILKEYGEILTPAQLRQLFIKLVAPLVVETALIATGKKKDYSSENSYAIKEAWTVASDMMKSSGDLKVIEAKNISDVIKLLPKGKHTITEIKELMSIMSVKADVEESESLTTALNKANESSKA